MNPRILLFFFLFLLSISIVFSQQNTLSFNESFTLNSPATEFSVNISQLSNTTITSLSTNSAFISNDTNMQWFISNQKSVRRSQYSDPINITQHWQYDSFQVKTRNPYFYQNPVNMVYDDDKPFIFTILEEDIILKPDSRIGLQYYNSLIEILFIKDNICQIMFNPRTFWDTAIDDNHTSIPVRTFCRGEPLYECEMNLDVPDNSTINFTMSQCTNDTISGIDKIAIFTGTENEGTISIYDNFRIENYYNGSNYMPSVNLTLDQDEFCMNGSYMQIPINVTAYDPENDTVYYINGKAQFSYNLNETVVEFSDEVFGVGLLPDATKIENSDLLLTDDICGIENNWNELYNTSAHNFVDWSHWLNPIPLWGLELNSNCSYYSNRTDYGLYYKITPMAGLSLKTRFAKWDGSDKLNISFYNIYRDELFSVEFRNYEANPGITNVYHKNTWLGNITNSQGNVMEFYVSPLGFAYNVTVIGLLYGSKTFNITGDPYADQVRYIGFHVTGSSVLDEFKYQGVSYTYTFLNDVSQWTTDVPNHVNITYPGSYQIDIIYSDSEHYPSSSETVSENLKIYSVFECRHLDADNIGIGTIDDHTTRTDPLGALAWLFGHGLVQFLNNTGYYEIGKILLWWIYIFMILILFFTTGRNSLSGAVLISSIAVGFLSLMIGYTSHFITSLILIAVSLAGPFAKIFGGD